MGTLDNGDADLSPRGEPVASLTRSCLGDNHSLVPQWALEVFFQPYLLGFCGLTEASRLHILLLGVSQVFVL